MLRKLELLELSLCLFDLCLQGLQSTLSGEATLGHPDFMLDLVLQVEVLLFESGCFSLKGQQSRDPLFALLNPVPQNADSMVR